MKKLLACVRVLSITMSGCDEGKPKSHYVLKEVIDVQGTCLENHVGQRDSYAGHIVHWQTVETGEMLTYGFVSIAFSPERAIDEATHPTVYHMPSMISFSDIDIDTNQPKWVLHGVRTVVKSPKATTQHVRLKW